MGREKYLIAINIVLAIVILISFYVGFKIKPSLSSHPDTHAITAPNIQQPAPSNVKVLSQSAPQTAQNRDKKKALLSPENCSQTCQARIMDKLQTQQALSHEDVILIEQHADIFAKQLAQETDLFVRLLSALEDEDTDKILRQPAALAVQSALSDADRKTVGTRLINNHDPAARIIGLGLIAERRDSADTLATLHQIISVETNPRVLIKAIDIISTQNTDKRRKVAALDTLIDTRQSDFIAGTALVAKANIIPAQHQTARDVQRALASSSVKMQSFGLQALTVMSQHKRGNSDKRVPINDPAFTDVLNAIIDDDNIAPEMRQSALKLIQGL